MALAARFTVQQRPRAIVTTSWDDGHPSDMAVAELLADNGVRGTFYVTAARYKDRGLPTVDLAGLQGLGMEIGAHTVTHPNLQRLRDTEGLDELRRSRQILADRTGTSISSFCYPYGKFDRRAMGWARLAGFRLARTTAAFRIDVGNDWYAMPVSMQLLPHRRRIHVRHALIEGNLRGLARWTLRYRQATDIVALGRRIFDDVVQRGGVFHLWGHSWEVERHDLWPQLRQLVSVVSGHPDVLYLTNDEVAAHHRRSKRDSV